MDGGTTCLDEADGKEKWGGVGEGGVNISASVRLVMRCLLHIQMDGKQAD